MEIREKSRTERQVILEAVVSETESYLGKIFQNFNGVRFPVKTPDEVKVGLKEFAANVVLPWTGDILANAPKVVHVSIPRPPTEVSKLQKAIKTVDEAIAVFQDNPQAVDKMNELKADLGVRLEQAIAAVPEKEVKERKSRKLSPAEKAQKMVAKISPEVAEELKNILF